MTEIGGVLPVVPTPFVDGRFDPESFKALLDHMLDGIDGYTLLGSTGEAPSMTVAERQEIAEAALAMTPGDKTVVVGISSTSVDEAVELARHAEANGARAVLCAAPYYFENSPDGVLAFLRPIDLAIGIDLILYDNPVATKTKLQVADVVSWTQELEHLRTVKLTDHAMEKVGLWKREGIDVFGGDDPILFEYLAADVDGVMVIAPAVFPAAFRDVWELIQGNRRLDAFRVFSREILPFIHVFGIGREIATTKALLADLGIFASGELRPPLQAVSAERRAILRHAYDLASEATQERLATSGRGRD